MLSILPAFFLNKSPSFVRRLLPQDCLFCGASSGAAMICDDCRRTLPYHDKPVCPQCASSTPTGGVCGRCLATPPAFDGAIAAFEYRYPLAEVLRAFKYGGKLALGQFLADALAARTQSERWPDFLVPMPLHSARLVQRGFNQAAEIARFLALATGLRLSLSTLLKIRDTRPQVDLPWKERRANVRGAFECDAELPGARVVIVDDVMTTGASLHEAAKALKKRGAVEVAVWVVARALPDVVDG
jgi:ComF family protein